jgi:hypothetical protein
VSISHVGLGKHQLIFFVSYSKIGQPFLILKVLTHFMQKRQIVETTIMVQETIHSSWTNKDKGMIIKIDMENVLIELNIPFYFILFLCSIFA